jgi:hypothetical protein
MILITDLEAYQTGTSLDSLPSPPKESTRGITVSEILFDRNGENSDTLTPYIHGQLSNRIYYCFELEPSGKSMVGRRVRTKFMNVFVFFDVITNYI